LHVELIVIFFIPFLVIEPLLLVALVVHVLAVDEEERAQAERVDITRRGELLAPCVDVRVVRRENARLVVQSLLVGRRAEVAQQDGFLLRDHNVLRLQVSVKNTSTVHVAQPP